MIHPIIFGAKVHEISRIPSVQNEKIFFLQRKDTNLMAKRGIF
jgi:hypothetical protein